jgi:hypothetical protein
VTRESESLFSLRVGGGGESRGINYLREKPYEVAGAQGERPLERAIPFYFCVSLGRRLKVLDNSV